MGWGFVALDAQVRPPTAFVLLLYLFGNNSIKRHLLRSFLAVGSDTVAAFGKNAWTLYN